jgi:hypothetical protein
LRSAPQASFTEEIVTYHRHRSIDRRRARSVVAMDITQVRPLISPDCDEGIIEVQNVHGMGRAGRESGRTDQ